jgi:prophage antirepressor-like protein
MELLKQIDETISFNEKNIRVIGTYQEPWFVAKDICGILELKNITEAMKIIPEYCRGSEKLNTFGGKQDMITINEAGLYRLIMRSNKPIAQKFQEVVCEEILPSLRKKGEYKIQSIIDKNKALEEEKLRIEEEKLRLEEEKQKILEEKEHEIKFKEYQLIKINEKNKKLESKLEKKRRARYEQTHSVYIISNPSIKGVCEKTGKKKNYFKLGKSSNRNSRLSNYASGAPQEYKIEYSRKLSSKREETAIENLMIIIFDNYRCINDVDQKREWLELNEKIDVNVLKKELDVLVNFMESRKKLYDFDRTEYYISESENEENIIDEEEFHNEISLPAPTSDDNSDDENNYENQGAEECKENINETSENDNEDEISDEDETYYDSDNENNTEEETMDFSNFTTRQIQLNPRDFDKFINECCELGDNLFTVKCELRNAHKIWSNCSLKDVIKDFDKYIKKFESGVEFINNSRRGVFRGLKLKKLEYTPTAQNLDYEKFISEKCSVHYDNRISYADFYSLFENYKKETNPEYKLSTKKKEEIKKYLNYKFINGRVYISTEEKSGGLHGVYGLGHISNNFGLKIVKRNKMAVGVYRADTNELLQTFESTILASEELKIPYSSLGQYIRTNKVIDSKIFKFIK